MQSLTVLATSDTLSSSRGYLNDNFTTALSNSSGTSFPTLNLVVGQFAYRSDTGATHQLKSTGPAVWVKMLDNDETYLSQEGADARYPYDAATSKSILGYTPANIAGDTFTGQVNIQGVNATSSGVQNLLANAGYNCISYFSTRAGAVRWATIKDAAAEAGSNAGSDYYIYRYNDAGAYIGTPIGIIRSTGVVYFEATPRVGAETIWHSGNDGSGSGLDADTVDGVQASALVQAAVESQTTKRHYPALTTLTDGATITWDLSLGFLAMVTLGGNRTLAFSGTIRAGVYTLIVKQPGSGGPWTLAMPASVKAFGGSMPGLSTAANKVDVMTFVSDGTDMFGTANIGAN